ncbi:hypothetical protein AX16_007255 [Volvariella volvacea WC 439]|nr:hypothetical protein AX16_007255 [Volvariella volvacea WC 439]
MKQVQTSPPAYAFKGSNSSHAKDTGSGSRTYHIPNYATSYASDGSKLIAVTIDEDRGSNKAYVILGLIFLLVGLPVIILSTRILQPDYGLVLRDRYSAQRDGARLYDGRPPQKEAQAEGFRGMDLKWEEPKPSERCWAYGRRVYTARLWDIPAGLDRPQACRLARVEIQGITFDKPDHCEDKGPWDGIIGHWIVDTQESACLPTWSGLQDQGCIGNRTNKRRFKSRLQGIQNSEGWKRLCMTAPATINGTEVMPNYCEDKGIWGIHGFWEFEDISC